MGREPERIFYEWHSATVVRRFLFSFDSGSATTNLQHTHTHTYWNPPPPNPQPTSVCLFIYFFCILGPLDAAQGTIGPLLKPGRDDGFKCRVAGRCQSRA